eukprot:1761143-Pleurochrysis_carterae.AAC.1
MRWSRHCDQEHVHTRSVMKALPAPCRRRAPVALVAATPRRQPHSGRPTLPSSPHCRRSLCARRSRAERLTADAPMAASTQAQQS